MGHHRANFQEIRPCFVRLR